MTGAEAVTSRTSSMGLNPQLTDVVRVVQGDAAVVDLPRADDVVAGHHPVDVALVDRLAGDPTTPSFRHNANIKPA